MRKTFLAGAAVMILFPMLVASSVSASVPKIDVSHAQAVCDASGTISFNPPLTSHVVPTKVKLSTKLTTCETTGAPSPVTLTKGTLKAAFDAAALSCTQLFNTPPLLHGAYTITWTADRHTPLLQKKTSATSVSGFGQQVTNSSLSRVHTQLTLIAQTPTGAFLGAGGTGTNVRTRMLFQPSTQAIGNLCSGAGVKSLAIGLGDQTAG